MWDSGLCVRGVCMRVCEVREVCVCVRVWGGFVWILWYANIRMWLWSVCVREVNSRALDWILWPPATDKYSTGCSVAQLGQHETFIFSTRPYWAHGVEFNLRHFSTIWSSVTLQYENTFQSQAVCAAFPGGAICHLVHWIKIKIKIKMVFFLQPFSARLFKVYTIPGGKLYQGLYARRGSRRTFPWNKEPLFESLAL